MVALTQKFFSAHYAWFSRGRSHIIMMIKLRKCWAYCAKELLQDLTEFVSGWTSHRMRKNRLADCPQGIPNDLYAMPQQFGNYKYRF